MGVSLLLVAVGAGVAYYHLEERLNSPRFKENLEAGISKALDGKMLIPQLEGHLGVHPWIGVENISFVGNNGDLQGTAKELRVAMEILPLLKRKVVFSHIKFISPHVRLRRRPDGSPPAFPRIHRIAGQNQGGLEFSIDHLLVNNAIIDFVDESRVEHPSIHVVAELTINRQTKGEGFDLSATGVLNGDRDKGQISVEGVVGDTTDLQLKAFHLPLQAGAAFFPEIAPWDGSVGVNARLSFQGNDRHWEINGKLKDVRLLASDTPLPVEVTGTVGSGSGAVVQAVWTSTRSQVTAEVTLPDLDRRRLFVQVKGPRLDLPEFVSFYSLWPHPSTGAAKPSAPWTMKAQVDLGEVAWNPWSAQQLKIVAEGSPTRGRLTELSCAVFQSTVSLYGQWGSSDTDKNRLSLTGRVESSSVTAHGQWQSALMPKAPRDFLFDRTSQWGIDVHVSSSQWKGVPLTEVDGHVSYGADGVLRATEVGAVCGGALSFEAEIYGLPETEPLTFAVNGRMKDIETRELLAAISTSTYLRHGQFSGALNVSGPLRPWDPNGLNGTASFNGRKGEFLTAPKVLEIFSALKINSLLRRVGGEKQTGLPFDVFEASGPIRAGRYILDQPLLLKNESFQMAYTGWMQVRFESGKGTLLFNFLESTSHVVKAIPVVGSLILGSNGELLPLVVDVVVENGKLNVTPRSVKTLTGPLVNVVKNVFRLPFQFFSPKKPKTE